jgi:hypothetical protein
VISLIAAAVDPDEARRVAREILNGRQYRSSPAPRPLRKQLDWIGDRVHGVIDWFGRAFSHLPSGIALGVATTAITLAIVYIVMRTRGRGNADTRRRSQVIGPDTPESPDELERAADDAERDGRLDEALRMRFRAGLLRLGNRGAIRYRPSVTTNEVRRVLGSETFEELARTFEGVAYGGHDAATTDVDTARREWPHVVASAAPRRTDDS